MTRPAPTSTAPLPPTVLLYGMGFVAFFLFGLVQAGYGPVYPLLGREYGQSVSAVGVVSSLHFAGSAAGTLLLGVLLSRLSLRSSLMVGGLSLMAGLLLVALSPSWRGLLVGATFGGVAYGMLSAGFNLAFASLGPGPSNLVNGLFGVGSVLSPVLVVALTRQTHGLPFLLMAGLAALLALGIRLLWPNPRSSDHAPSVGKQDVFSGESVSVGGRQTGEGQTGGGQPAPPAMQPVRSSRRVLALFGLCFFLYVGIEAGLGNWATTYFVRLGADQPALLTSFYWTALTVGRFAFAAVGNRLTPLQTMSFALTGTMIGTLTMLLGGLKAAPYGLVLAGFCIAPVFSTQLAWFTRTQSPRLAPLMLTLGSVGGAVLPALTGLALPRMGAPSVPLVPLLIAALLLLCVLLLHWRLSRVGRASPPSLAQS